MLGATKCSKEVLWDIKKFKMQGGLECTHTVLFEGKKGTTKEKNKVNLKSYKMALGYPDMNNDINFKPGKLAR